MTNSADSDKWKPTDLDLHCLQRQGIPDSAGLYRVKLIIKFLIYSDDNKREFLQSQLYIIWSYCF